MSEEPKIKAPTKATVITVARVRRNFAKVCMGLPNEAVKNIIHKRIMP
jgi:hypothetical protein